MYRVPPMPPLDECGRGDSVPPVVATAGVPRVGDGLLGPLPPPPPLGISVYADGSSMETRTCDEMAGPPCC